MGKYVDEVKNKIEEFNNQKGTITHENEIGKLNFEIRRTQLRIEKWQDEMDSTNINKGTYKTYIENEKRELEKLEKEKENLESSVDKDKEIELREQKAKYYTQTKMKFEKEIETKRLQQKILLATMDIPDTKINTIHNDYDNLTDEISDLQEAISLCDSEKVKIAEEYDKEVQNINDILNEKNTAKEPEEKVTKSEEEKESDSKEPEKEEPEKEEPEKEEPEKEELEKEEPEKEEPEKEEFEKETEEKELDDKSEVAIRKSNISKLQNEINKLEVEKSTIGDDPKKLNEINRRINQCKSRIEFENDQIKELEYDPRKVEETETSLVNTNEKKHKVAKFFGKLFKGIIGIPGAIGRGMKNLYKKHQAKKEENTSSEDREAMDEWIEKLNKAAEEKVNESNPWKVNEEELGKEVRNIMNEDVKKEKSEKDGREPGDD